MYNFLLNEIHALGDGRDRKREDMYKVEFLSFCDF
jgi:hypothetical protein